MAQSVFTRTSHHALRWDGRLVENQKGFENEVGPRTDLISSGRSGPSKPLKVAFYCGTYNLVPRGTQMPYSAAVDLVARLGYRSCYMALTGWDLTDAQRSFTMLPLAPRLHWHPVSELPATYSISWLTRCYGHRTGLRRFGLAGFSRGTVYSRPPYPTSGGTQATKQQDVRVEEYFSGGTMARGTFAFMIESWTSVPAIPPSSYTDYYMDWFFPRSHPRI
ncbi:hypothetical protein M9H77_17779 [Catharanthus roseus]|uniref:Uncharacterized protein n=1 Tax=Catharanthus roseus TaxID=4058 RepID=A0ACC0B5L3_CATRO|nr:hypothetical protein M9H77_17779 [Catharanthus roseus]